MSPSIRRPFCTIFDRNYLVQALALFHSLRATHPGFDLYCLCLDDESFALVEKLAAPASGQTGGSARLIALSRSCIAGFDGLLSRMTYPQVCWTCQPLFCGYLLSELGLPEITYLEADSLFFSSPEALFEELKEASVSLVPHRYAKKYRKHERTSGTFCVQFNFFRADENGRRILREWTDACLEYSRERPLSFPGQLCLNQWPGRPGVAVIQNIGAGVAPWNVSDFKVTRRDGRPQVNGVPVVFYHFHAYGRDENDRHELGAYPLPPESVKWLYVPYVLALRSAETEARKLMPSFASRRRIHRRGGVRGWLSRLKRRWLGTYNVISDEEIPSKI